VYYSCIIAKQQGFKKVAVATDRFQSRTLADFLPKVRRKTKVDVHSLPMQVDLMFSMTNEDPKIDFQSARVENFVSIVDRESKLKRFWGTMGKHIDYSVDHPETKKERTLPSTN
jgi:hypothetical protein